MTVNFAHWIDYAQLSAFYCFSQVVNYLFVCAGCLVYVDSGPGGEYIGNIIHTMTTELKEIDWSTIFENIQTNTRLAFYNLFAVTDS